MEAQPEMIKNKPRCHGKLSLGNAAYYTPFSKSYLTSSQPKRFCNKNNNQLDIESSIYQVFYFPTAAVAKFYKVSDLMRDICFLPVLEARSQKSRGRHDHPPCQGSRGGFSVAPFQLLLIVNSPSCCLAYALSLFCASFRTCHAPCVCV